MDKSLQQKLYGGPTNGSPNSSAYCSPRSSRLSMPAMNSGSPRTSMYGGSVLNQSSTSIKRGALNNSSRFSVSVRSNQSIAGIKSDYNVVESYGNLLPVAINEALNFKDITYNISVKSGKNGWAWVVTGRRLLIWQYKETPTGVNSSKTVSRVHQRRTGGVAQCRELTLPHCDIGHKAALISVFQIEGQHMVSCIAVSPTGDARYWASIAHDSSSVDATNILEGQEFDKLINMPQLSGYLLVTTTCNLVFLQVKLSNGRPVLQHKAIKQPTGFLGGIGKKFASIIIGINNNSDREPCLVNMACESSTKKETVVAVLSDRFLQRWSLGSSEQLIYEDSEIVRKIREECKLKFWHMRMPNDTFDIILELLDMHIYQNKYYILVGAVNEAHTPQMYYGLVVLFAEDLNMQLDEFVPLKLSQFYSKNTEQECLNMRFIITRTHFYFYTANVVYPLHFLNSNPTGELEAEKIEFHIHEDRILSAVVTGHIAIFFSRVHGFVSITPGDFDSNDMLNMSVSNAQDIFGPLLVNESQSNEESMNATVNESNNLHLLDLDPDDIYNEFNDEVSHMKAAFVYRTKRNNRMVNEVVNDLLERCADSDTANEAYKLDRIVVTVAEDLAEDIPIGDPRWEIVWENQQLDTKQCLGSSRAMRIIMQLRDKSTALQQFIEFLHATGLWEKLNVLPNGGGNVLKPTCYVLADINEKIIAAITLRSLQNDQGNLIEEAIEHVVEQWQEQLSGKLTPQDLFYVKLCKFQHIYQAFVDIIDKRINASQQSTASTAICIFESNAIILETLNQVYKYREQNAATFALSSDKLDTFEYLPWTALSGNAGIRDAITYLIDVTVRHGAHCATDVELKQKLYQQILELVDILLDGRKNYMESVRDQDKQLVLQQQFESQRREFISLLIEEQQYEFATKLAEKYMDFHSLVVICDVTGNQERLNDYVVRYDEQNFSQFAINWHLSQNRGAEIFDRFKNNLDKISRFMRAHPTLYWLQLIFNGDAERASKVLIELAQTEMESVERKKTMLCQAKLATYAAADSDLTEQWDLLNTEIKVIEYQEQLGENVLKAYGYDVYNQRVLKVEEIINLLICEENEEATEVDFRKALELLIQLEDAYEIRHKIWCAAILRDNWTDYDMNNAMGYVQKLLFFKLIELCHLMDGECESFLPPMGDFLHSPELADLVQSESFEYLLKLTYEYVNDAFKKSESNEMEL